MFANVVLYGKLRFCERGISSGNSEVCKKATSFSLNQIQQFFIQGVSQSYFYFSFFHCSVFSKYMNFELIFLKDFQFRKLAKFRNIGFFPLE
jgi:hypothetical protein